MGQMIPENREGAKPVEMDAAEQAAAFLERIATGSGRVAIAAIPPDEKPQGVTLALPGDRHRLLTVLREASERTVNLHFTLNEPKPRAEQVGKAGKLCEADVAAIRGVAVDIDPDPQAEAAPGGFERERRRLSLLALEALSDPECPATAAIDSGNGVQLLWLFPEPLPATEENREAVKRQAAGLAQHFGGDAVQSLDHLFRIPFTRNIPNAKKRAKGRHERPTALLAWNDANRHPLEALAAIAPPADSASKTGPAVTLVDLDFGAVLDAAHGGPDALPEHLKGWAAKLQERRGFSSAMEKADRSARDFELVANCASMGMTDPGAIAQLVFAFSPEKLLEEEETRGAGERYAQRTVSKALATAERDPAPEDFFQPVEMECDAVASNAPRGRGFSLTRVGEMVVREPDFLVQDLFERDSLALLFGDPGCGKSFFALALAASVATGRSFNGRKVKSGPVVYIAGEGQNGLRRRLSAWETHFGIDLSAAPLFISGGPTSLLEPAAVKQVAAALDEVAAQAGAPALIVLDTLARNFGPGDENDTQHMSAFISAVDALRRMYRACAALIVHHTGHGDKARARGSMALRAALDAEYRMEKTGNAVTITNTKMKDAAPPPPAHFEMETVEVGKSSTGETIESAVLIEVAAKPTAQVKGLSASEQIALKSFRASRDQISGNDRASVPREVWRETFYSAYPADKNSAKKVAFDRATRALVAKGYLDASDENYTELWPAE